MRTYLASAVVVLLPVALALPADEKPAPKDDKAVTVQKVEVNVKPYEPPAPPVSINLKGRHGTVTPHKDGCCHTGGGNIDVAQPTPDVLIVTMGGVAVAAGSPCGGSSAAMDFHLEQYFEVTFDNKDLKKAKMTMEGRLIGLLRGGKKGCGSESHGCASVGCPAAAQMLSLCLPDHSACDCDNLSVNDREGPVSVPVVPGKYTLEQTFHIEANQGRTILPCKPASSEFAPDPALDPLWISFWEPFHGAIKKDFGLQITIKVAEDTDTATAEAPKEEAPKEPEPGKERLPLPRPEPMPLPLPNAPTLLRP
jgi:hypothetical protein